MKTILLMALAGSAGLIVLAKLVCNEGNSSDGRGGLTDDQAAGKPEASHFPDLPTEPAAASSQRGVFK